MAVGYARTMATEPPPTPVVPSRIETARCVLRPYELADGPALHAAVNASLAELRPWLPWTDWHPDVAASTETCRRLRAAFDARADFTMGIFDRADGRLLGGTGLHRVKWELPSFEIGYWLRTDAVGRGIVTETTAALVRTCFEALGAVRVELITDPRNERSGKVAERVGFRLEGTLRNGMLGTDRRPADRRVWGLTRDDWAHERARIVALATGARAARAT